MSTYTKGTLTKKTKKEKKDKRRTHQTMLLQSFSVFVFLIFFLKHMLWYSFALHQQVDAIQMGIHNICLYKEVDRKYTGYLLMTMELLKINVPL